MCMNCPTGLKPDAGGRICISPAGNNGGSSSLREEEKKNNGGGLNPRPYPCPVGQTFDKITGACYPPKQNS